MSEDIKNNEFNEDTSCGCGCGCGSEDEAKVTDDACGCGHDHDHEHHHHDVITLTLDNDEEVECAVLGVFDVEDQEYIALLPNDSDDVFLYIYHEDEDGNVNLENIESQEDFDKVSAIFLEIIESENEEDEE